MKQIQPKTKLALWKESDRVNSEGCVPTPEDESNGLNNNSCFLDPHDWGAVLWASSSRNGPKKSCQFNIFFFVQGDEMKEYCLM